jgi:hypothetical protein
MGKKSAPAAPDYASLATQQAAQQQQLDTQNTWSNRANQSNPFASLNWTTSQAIDPTTGQAVTQWNQNTTYDPTLMKGMQAQYGAQATGAEAAQGMAGNLGNVLGQVDTSGFTNWGGTPYQTTSTDWGGSGNARQSAEDALYKSATSRLDPQWQQRQGDLETQLANQGITRNSDAYTRAMTDMSNQRNDAYTQAQNTAATGATQQAQALQGMDLSQQQQAYNQNLGISNFQDQQRGQQLGEAQGLQSQYLTNYLNLLGGSQANIPSFGDYTQGTASKAADITGAGQAQYGAAMDAQNAKNASAAGTTSAVAGVAGAALMVF